VDRAQKENVVASLHEALADMSCVVVTHQTGLTVAEVTQLRRQIHDVGASYKVTKNRLARRAVVGTSFESLLPLFVGPTALAYSRDPVAAAKIVVEFANRNTKLTIVGGGLAGQPLDPAAVKALASLPSLDELRATLVRLLQTPATRLAVLLQAPAAQIARVLAAHAEKDAAPEEAAAEEAAAS
jgi:large subunit ribosomal protein L10